MRGLLLFSSLLISVGALAREQTPRFGVTITSTAERACATFPGDELRQGQEVHFATFHPPRWTSGRIAKRRAERCETRDVVEGVAYDVQLKQPGPGSVELGVAVVIDEEKLSIENGLPVVLKENRSITLRSCTSFEGVHLSAWRGKVRAWHEYYYLGYDVEPSCSEGDSDEFQR